MFGIFVAEDHKAWSGRWRYSMKKFLIVAMATAALMVLAAGPAFAAHCVNLSKPAGAGGGVIVLVDVSGPTEVVTVSGHGGYADVWLDFDGDGTGDLLVESDIQVGKNHSYVGKDGSFPAEVEPWINPGAIQKFSSEHATKTHGMGFHAEP
jgi:hypothetical protein